MDRYIPYRERKQKYSVFDVKHYNFSADDEFQKFKQAKQGGKLIPRAKYRAFICACEREWIAILKDVYKRQAHGLSEDYGFDFLC